MIFALFADIAQINEAAAADFPQKSTSRADMYKVFALPEREEAFSECESTNICRSREAARLKKTPAQAALILEKHADNPCKTAKITLLAKNTVLLAQIIVIYIFNADGKKRLGDFCKIHSRKLYTR